MPRVPANLSLNGAKPKPYWVSQDGTCTVYRGDCLDVMRHIGRVDAVVTDPPYGVQYSYESYDDDPKLHKDKITRWFTAFTNATAGPVCVFCGIRQIWSWPPSHWILSCRKTFSVSRSPFGSNNWEPVLVYQKCRHCQRASDSFEATFIYDVHAAEHPCPKPVEALVNVLLIATKPNEIVLDPFTGSGTTGVACIRSGRKFIGIEIEERYCEVAVSRMARERPFPPMALPKQIIRRG